MEVTYFEDPACGWCWAFEPVATRFTFELRHLFKVRRVLGGLRDRPPIDVDFIVRQWRIAARLSGMPFDVAVWEHHVLESTFCACRAVKAASLMHGGKTSRLLRRLREAYFTERAQIDDLESIVSLAAEVGLDTAAFRENLASGRAEEIFARDRLEAENVGFGFPSILLSSGNNEEPTLLQGSVPYQEILRAVYALGVPEKERRLFRDLPEDWQALFDIHPRLTVAEIREVTGLGAGALLARAPELGLTRSGALLARTLPRERAAEQTSGTEPRTAPVEQAIDPIGEPGEAPELPHAQAAD